MSGNSYAALLSQWELLLKAVTANETELAELAPFRASLEDALAIAASAQKRRDTLRVAAQEATRQQTQAFRACAEAALTLRCYLKAMLGPRNLKLLRYGIKPIRERRRARRVVLTAGLRS